MNSALQTALLLARRFDSYIEGFALQPGISQFLADHQRVCPQFYPREGFAHPRASCEPRRPF